MAIKIFKKDNQANGNFNGGEILEKKPIGFPQDGGKLRPYSNLFYWAHAWAPKNVTNVDPNFAPNSVLLSELQILKFL